MTEITSDLDELQLNKVFNFEFSCCFDACKILKVYLPKLILSEANRRGCEI